MILSFSTKINGKPTCFPEKIWQGFIEKKISDSVARYVWLQGTPYPKDGDRFKIGRNFEPKIHTIREDKNNRWKPGVIIDFFINARQKNMFRFAPRIPVVSTQEIKIHHGKGNTTIYIDGKWFGEIFHSGFDDIECYTDDLLEMAQNDGFVSLEEFLQYFNTNYKGKIIHWTEFQYY